MCSEFLKSMEDAMTPLCRKNLIDGKLNPRSWSQASVVCMDIVDFTRNSGWMVPDKVCDMLTIFYNRMDDLAEAHHVDKVDIIGDAYVALAESAEDAVRFCLDSVALAKCTLWDPDDISQGTIMLRCAVNTGRVVGLVLDAACFKYTLVGDTYVTTKRMEGEAVPGAVHCSISTASFLNDVEFHVVCQSAISAASYSVTLASPLCKTVVCPVSMRFISVSDAFVVLFGFKRRELHSLRMIYGPLTRVPAVQVAMDQCFQFNYPTNTVVVLYNRMAAPVCTAVGFEKDPTRMMGLAVDCVALDRIMSPPRRASVAEH